jgi:hypothetical protein
MKFTSLKERESDVSVFHSPIGLKNAEARNNYSVTPGSENTREARINKKSDIDRL